MDTKTLDKIIELKQKGQTINPYVDITPEKLAEFLGQAQREIDPYYASQMGLARESLLNTLGYSKEETGRFEADLEKKYGKALQAHGESMAEKGFALSGRRLTEESDLAYETQKTMEDQRRQLAFQAGNQARQFAQEWGGTNMPSFNIGAMPTVRSGEMAFGKTGTQMPLYELSSDIYSKLTGSRQWEQQAAEKTRQAELEEAFKQKELASRYRTLELT